MNKISSKTGLKLIKSLLVLTLITFFSILFFFVGQSSAYKSINTRDYNYEQYCDDLWENNREYYLDVLVETDEYQQYIVEHGKWW